MLLTTILLPLTKGGVLTTQTLLHDSRCCKRLFSCPLVRRESHSSKLKCTTLDVANDFLLLIRKGGVLPTQTLVHDSRCCKRLFSCLLGRGSLTQTQLHYYTCCKRLFTCPLSSGESYPPKFKCMTPEVANDYSPAHYYGGSLTHTNSSARLQIWQTTFLFPFTKGEYYPSKF